MGFDSRQILELGKQGLNAEEIAAALGYDVELVTTVLTKGAEVPALADTTLEKPKARGMMFDDSMEQLAVATVKDILLDTEVKAQTRLNAARTVIEERKGLLEPKVATNVTFNIMDFNERLQQMRRRREELERVIDVQGDTKLVAA